MKRIALFFILVSLIACKEKEETPETPAQVVANPNDTLPYYDIRATILQELEKVSTITGVKIFQQTEQDGAKKLKLIDTTTLKEIARPFYDLDLNNPAIKKQYKESVFEDTDTKSFVLNYITTSSSLPVKSASVMLDNQYQDFKRLDMSRTYGSKDTTFEERFTWIAGESFRIVQMATVDGKESMKKINVTWR